MSAEDAITTGGRGSIYVSTANTGYYRSQLYGKRPEFSERIDDFVTKLNGFFMYNRNYEQNGTIQFAVSAKLDVGCYQVSEKEYVESILISKSPLDGTNFYVANLEEVRRRAGAVRSAKRCHYSRTYYVEKVGGVWQVTLLFDNNQWLDARKIEEAFSKLLWIKGGRVGDFADVPVEKASAENWRYFSYGKLNDVGYVRYYEFFGEKRVLAAMINSGTILDVDASELTLLDDAKSKKSGSEFSNSLLRFKFMSDNILCRCKGL